MSKPATPARAGGPKPPSATSKTALTDYREQLGRPFEQEARLRELLGKQADINRSLDLDKSDTQIVDEEKVA